MLRRLFKRVPAAEQPSLGIFAYLEPGQPLLMLDLRKYDEPAVTRRKRSPRRVAVGGLAAVAIIASGLQVLPAAAAPTVTRALESVDLTLGTDGKITGILANDLLADENGGFSSRRSPVDPAQAINRLPVVVTVGYLYDGRAGTDLKDLSGVSGNVEINVTVTNTSAEARPYPSGVAGAPPTYAQVVMPLTVVGSATLPMSSATSLVTPPTGASAPHTTNGLISTGRGQSLVQWAAVLAPPRTGATTTFRVVEKAKKFVLPELTIRVTPGLSADPSLEALITRAFGQDSPILGLQKTTARLIVGVNKSLTYVQGILDGIHTELLAEASSTGVNATNNLKSTSASAATSLTQLTNLLTQLNGTLSSSLNDANTLALDSLAGSLTKLQKDVGLPDSVVVATASPTATAAAKCGTTNAPTATTTLYGQLLRITELLRQTARVTEACVTTMRATLLKSIGTATDCVSADAKNSIACRLEGTKATLEVIKTSLSQRAGDISDALENTGLSGIGTALDGTKAEMATLQAKLDDLSSVSGSGGDLSKTLKSASDAVSKLVKATSSSSGSGLGHEIAALNDSAVTALAALGDSTDSSGVDSTQGALTKLTAEICALPAVDPVDATLVSDYADGLRQLIDGGDCAGGAATTLPSSSLRARLAEDRMAWQSVRSQTDLAAATGAGAELVALQTDLLDLQTALGEAQDQLDPTAPSPGSVAAELAIVKAKAKAIYDPADPMLTCGGDVTSPASLNALTNTFAKVACKQDEVTSQLSSFQQATVEGMDTADDAVSAAGEQAQKAGAAADLELGDALAVLKKGLESSATDELTRGTTALQQEIDDLAASVKTSQGLLTDKTKAAISDVGTGLDDAKARNAEQTRALKDSLKAVVEHLGAPQSGGLLGKIYASGASVKADGSDPIQVVANQSSGFAAVRQLEAAALELQNRQFEDGLGRVGSTWFLGGDLPRQASHLSVYTFRMVGV